MKQWLLKLANRLTPALKRAVRSFLQGFLGLLAGTNLLALFSTGGVVDWSEADKLLRSAIAAGFIAVLTWGHNALEDHGVIPAMLKPPVTTSTVVTTYSAPTKPPRDSGQSWVAFVAVIALVLAVALALGWVTPYR